MSKTDLEPVPHHEEVFKKKLIRVLHPVDHPLKEKEMQPLFVWKGKEYVSAWSELSGLPRPQGPPQEKSLWVFLWVEPGIEDNACAIEIWDRKEKGKYSVVYYKMDEADHRIIIKGSEGLVLPKTS